MSGHGTTVHAACRPRLPQCYVGITWRILYTRVNRRAKLGPMQSEAQRSAAIRFSPDCAARIATHPRPQMSQIPRRHLYLTCRRERGAGTCSSYRTRSLDLASPHDGSGPSYDHDHHSDIPAEAPDALCHAGTTTSSLIPSSWVALTHSACASCAPVVNSHLASAALELAS
jgi:hypothetical protein